MAQQEGEWITVNGRHILVGSGESRDEAINRVIAQKNAETKNKQIAQRKAEADVRNNKSSNRGGLHDFVKSNKLSNHVVNKLQNAHSFYRDGLVSKKEALSAMRDILKESGVRGDRAKAYEDYIKMLLK